MIAGRYTVGREIGRGGMGAVHLARDEVLGRDVAIKRIGMLPGATTPDLERAEREARLAAMLNHPHVVSVFDLVADQDQHWLVMEYVEGESLADRIRSNGPIDHADAAGIIWQVADALASAHEAGITHRDVKPSNILLTPTGQAKLTDFGIAKSQADASLTQTGLVTGSPAYLAPEVASGTGAGAPSDVWSLGATLFHMLAGSPPYDVADNLMGGLYKVVHEEPPRLPDAGPFDELLRSTMVRDPEARWSMANVRDRLLEIRDARPGEGTTTTQVMPAVPAAATEVIDEPVGPVRPVPPAQPVPPAEPAESAAPAAVAAGSPERRPRWPWVAALAAAAAVVLVLVLLNSGDKADDDPEQAATEEPSSQSTSESPTQTTSDQPPSPTAASTREEVAEFVTTYLSTVTSDPATTFEMLTPAFQQASGGYGDYSGFWGTIESAQPSNIRVNPKTLTVTYDVTYQTVDGRTLNESNVLQLARSGDGYLIAGEP
ncbi:serine/threonine-protein kinase [Nocardioides piscis]|uniref:non-specific serine/threonine protein kinase n=1 Tax=Nocardioides piscis TaxID=2714938 RepID=A0A6G7YHD7_9ACTN|nr:serine/threonine-protein kinase [Nocardioides piscis]QIK76048.1 serine/threonine protein kinase [Nocardioides piscis]